MNQALGLLFGDIQKPSIDIYLRDVYARVQSSAITEFTGLSTQNDDSERAAIKRITTGEFSQEYFLKATDIYRYLYRHKSSHEHDIVTIVIPGLRDQYYSNKLMFNTDERQDITIKMSTPRPTFFNIWDYKKLEHYQDIFTRISNDPVLDSGLIEYQVFGEITPYDVVHISVKDFIQAINDRQPIIINIPLMTITLWYEPSDFFDPQFDMVLTQV